MTPILLLEINEVPWKIIDHYTRNNEIPNVRRFFENADQFTTVTVDTGELSPWVTWPSFHRGMGNLEHKIKNLGQDPKTFCGTPVWEDIRASGGTIGICGSMQSWPPIDPGKNGFYLPDTFAHDESCIPNYLNPIQAFNLSQVKKNARVVNSKLPSISELTNIASALMKSGITLNTVARLTGQLIGERFDKSLVGRRSTYQSILFWDVFCKHYNPVSPPDFSTFFSNHVAGLMHRYWCDVFPEEFPEFADKNLPSHEHLMRFAFHVLDDILAKVMQWAEKNPELLVIFASSMGQAAVHRDQHEGFELVVDSVEALMSKAGLTGRDYKPLMAMVPQIAVEIADANLRSSAKQALESFYCGADCHFISVQEIGISLSITVGTPPKKDITDNLVKVNGNLLPLNELGIYKQDIEPGTAYHIPEGSLAFYSAAKGRSGSVKQRSKVSADKVKSWMLDINKNGYTTAKPEIMAA